MTPWFSDLEDQEQDAIAMIYRAQADLAMLVELMARDRGVRLAAKPLAYLAVFDHELERTMPTMARH